MIENKVESAQGGSQLAGYREKVERLYEHANRRVYLFLTKSGEAPNDKAYIPTTYNEVAVVLSACLAEKEGAVASGPRHLLTSYLELLSDDFMSENESTRLA